MLSSSELLTEYKIGERGKQGGMAFLIGLFL